MTAKLWIASGVLAVGLVLGSGFTDWWNDRQHRADLVELANEAARQDSTRQVAIGIYQRRAMVAESEREVAAAMAERAREEAKRAKLRARAVHTVDVTAGGEITGTAQAAPDTTDTVIPVDLEDRGLSIQGSVRIHDYHVPATAPIDVVLRAALVLDLEVALLEDASGAPVVQVATESPHVTALDVRSVVDLRRTGLGEDDGPSRLRWGLAGAAVGVGICLFFCPR